MSMILPEFSGSGVELFPLDSEQVERSLDQVREDPKHILLDLESSYLEFNNPYLSFLLICGQGALPDRDVGAYTEASLTTYKLAREAGTRGGVLPILSKNGSSYLAGVMVATLKEARSASSDIPVIVSEVTRGAFETELTSEPSILSVVKRLADHRVDRDVYYTGAATVVAGLRLAATESSPGAQS